MNPKVISKIAEEFRSLNYQVPRYQPIVGENAFTTAAGIHVDAQLRNPMTYLSMDPEVIGRRANIVIGPYSGRSSIEYWLRLMVWTHHLTWLMPCIGGSCSCTMRV
ncbi:homocitrate synthase/isopropylmalate synthase family protein [Vulcanisaeta sp. JCM 14467]|uniref:homocitrate synthase/isopropylmalate synthase family protein n=1 Tax=Vulcanisaeta sp. JCM 14467 TaxID=1295370 RepID=UPI000ADCCBD7|nr:hypothetical protein [Vulcanisaeta sp. JCM 14467]